MLKKIARFMAYAFLVSIALTGVGLIIFFFILTSYGQTLPDYSQLKDYKPPIVTRLYAEDGRLLSEYAIENRIFVPIQFVPKVMVKAIIAAEDKSFYQHRGVDFYGIARAIVQNIGNYAHDRRMVGASTITQQVAKNFLLGNERTIDRKIKEAILAMRIERTLNKDQIMELYLNQIYFGYGAYGVAAAELAYFDKPLDEISLVEAAYLAALPKGPNNYHPVTRYDAAVDRRNWVLERMFEENYITKTDLNAAKTLPLVVKARNTTANARGDYFAEEVRRFLAQEYGSDVLYRGGLTVRTTMDATMQKYAEEALQEGLVAYDRRHGWRGVIKNIAGQEDWKAALQSMEVPGHPESWRIAAVKSATVESATIMFEGGATGIIPLSQVKWARKWLKGEYLGAAVNGVNDVLKRGDVIFVEKAKIAAEEGEKVSSNTYALRQVPAVNGAMVVIDPHTGRVLGLVGGFSFDKSEFNRATQAKRQPGSAFKPLVYLTALDNGFTPASLILDAPFVIDQGGDQGLWKPDNYTKEFYGPAPLRTGIEQSRNLMTVRLAQAVGMDKVSEMAKRLGVVDNMPEVLSSALGAQETTLMRLTTAYAMIGNGGKRVIPTLIDRIQDRNGVTIYRHDQRQCDACKADDWQGQNVPLLPDNREQVLDPITDYQMISMLQGVIQRGTGRRIAVINKPIAGKTGTTNESNDAWFVGFSPNLVAGVYIGFDSPRSLGEDETAANIAAPVFAEFMQKALANQPSIPFRVPDGVEFVRVNLDNGKLAQPGDEHVILEAFKPGTQPSETQDVLDTGQSRGGVGEDTGLEGIY